MKHRRQEAASYYCRFDRNARGVSFLIAPRAKAAKCQPLTHQSMFSSIVRIRSVADLPRHCSSCCFIFFGSLITKHTDVNAAFDRTAAILPLRQSFSVSNYCFFCLLQLLSGFSASVDAAGTIHPGSNKSHSVLRKMYFVSRYSCNPSGEPSRPRPLSLTPPNGAVQVVMMPSLTPTKPHSILWRDEESKK